MSSLSIRLIGAFIVALCLTILPMPTLFIGLKPPWILLLILYIQFYIAEYFNLIMIITLGLILDILLSTVIGEHIFALTAVTWIASNKSRRFYFFSMSQQMALISLFCLFYQLTIVIIDAFLGFQVQLLTLVINPIISLLIWPWLRLVADSGLPKKIKYHTQM